MLSTALRNVGNVENPIYCLSPFHPTHTKVMKVMTRVRKLPCFADLGNLPKRRILCPKKMFTNVLPLTYTFTYFDFVRTRVNYRQQLAFYQKFCQFILNWFIEIFFFLNDIILLVASSIFANILLSLNIFQCIGIVECLRNLRSDEYHIWYLF